MPSPPRRSGRGSRRRSWPHSSAGSACSSGALPALADHRPAPELASRESAFLFNNVLFLAVTLVVCFGTLLPLVIEGATGGRLGLGAPYFNALNAPIFAALLFLMAIGPALPWGGASWRTLRDRFGLPTLLGRRRHARGTRAGDARRRPARHAVPGAARPRRARATRSCAARARAAGPAARRLRPPPGGWRPATGAATAATSSMPASASWASRSRSAPPGQARRARPCVPGADDDDRRVPDHPRPGRGGAAPRRPAGDRAARRAPLRRCADGDA